MRTAQPIAGAQGRGVQKPGNVPVPAGENAPVMAQSAPEDKSKKEVAGLANAPRQTEPSGNARMEARQKMRRKPPLFLIKKGRKENQERLFPRKQ